MKSIKGKILAYCIGIILISLTAVGGIAAYLNYSSTIDSLNQTMTESVSIASHQVDAMLERYRTLAVEFAGADYNVRTDVLKKRFDETASRHNFTSMDKTDAKGTSLVTGIDVSDRDYFVQARDRNTAYVSDLTIRKDDGTMNLFISAPVMKDGQFDGVVFVGVDASFLCDIVSNISVGESGNASMLSGDGTTIGYADVQLVLDQYNTQNEYQADPDLTELAELERKAASGESGFGSYSYGGESKFMAYAPIANTNGWSIYVSVLQSEFLSSTYIAILYTVIASAVALLIAVALLFGLANSIVMPIKLCVNRIVSLSKGDLKTEVPQIKTRDETRLLADATAAIANTVDQIISDVSWEIDEMAKGNFTFKSRVPELYIGDFTVMQTEMQNVVQKLTHTLLQINQSSDQVAAGSNQVSAGAQALSQGATEQASSVEELAATINEISSQVSTNAQSAQQAMRLVEDTGAKLSESNRQVQEMMAAMSDISERSGQIGKIIKTIEDIAFQTNILALNAAVEAARAGAAGKGFAVVADEVRNLASKSAEASKSTAGLIEGSIQAVENGTKIAGETAQIMLETVAGAQRVTEIIDEISHASDEQASSITQVTQGIDQISSVVQTNSATAEESAAASEELSSQAQMLKDLVGQFKL